MRLPDFEAWAVFATVAEHRSFSRAAEALAMSKATVSKAVSRLEQQLGIPLFHRTSRRLALTESGIALAEHARRILAEGEAAVEAAREDAAEPAGRVRLAAPMSFGLAHVGPVIAEFLELHPAISVDLHLSDARIDLVAEGFDAALRIASLPDSSLRARKLRDVATFFVASPAYLDRYGRPRHAAELADHACFCYSYLPTPELWHLHGPDGSQLSVRPSGRLRANNGEAMLPGLCAGLGIAYLPDFIVGEALASGRLEAVLPGWRLAPVALYLLTPPGTIRSRRVTTLLDFLGRRLAVQP